MELSKSQSAYLRQKTWKNVYQLDSLENAHYAKPTDFSANA